MLLLGSLRSVSRYTVLKTLRSRLSRLMCGKFATFRGLFFFDWGCAPFSSGA